MIYVVSGYRRSGTSVMMAALKASGLPIMSNSRLDDFTAGHKLIDGYKPTKDLLYEVGRDFYINPKIMRDFVKNHDDIGIKVFFDGLPILPPGDYTVIFMQRDAQEIAESLKKVDHYKRSYNANDTRRAFEERPEDRPDRYPFDAYSRYRPKDIQQCLDIAHLRSDMSVVEVQFRDLIEDPVQTFERLRTKGVPINVDNASKIIDPDWYRCVA